MTRKRGGGLFWWGGLLLTAAAVDQFYLSRLGSLTIVAWGLGGLAIFVAILLRLLSLSSQSAYVQIEEDGLIVSYGGYELPVSYEDIGIITGGRVSQHHSLTEFGRRERQAIEPYFNQTHIFIALHKETDEITQAKDKMPRFIFGTTQAGLLLLVEGDWLMVERAIDAARVKWLGQVKSAHQEDRRSIAAKLWDEDDEYEDES